MEKMNCYLTKIYTIGLKKYTIEFRDEEVILFAS